VWGLAVRDGQGTVGSTTGVGYKLALYLEGAPKSFTLNGAGRSMSVTDFRPPSTANILVLDAELDNVFNPMLDVYAYQAESPGARRSARA
jgi:hypothetical protein